MNYRPSNSRHLGAVDVPWDQLIEAGTTVATTAITQSGKHGGRKKPRKAVEQVAAPTVEATSAPAPSVGPPWGPILLVGGAVAAALIYASGGKKP